MLEKFKIFLKKWIVFPLLWGVIITIVLTHYWLFLDDTKNQDSVFELFFFFFPLYIVYKLFSIKSIKTIIKYIFVLTIFPIIVFFINFINIDSCLDQGGVWNYLEEKCIHSEEEVIEYLKIADKERYQKYLEAKAK